MGLKYILVTMLYNTYMYIPSNHLTTTICTATSEMGLNAVDYAMTSLCFTADFMYKSHPFKRRQCLTRATIKHFHIPKRKTKSAKELWFSKVNKLCILWNPQIRTHNIHMHLERRNSDQGGKKERYRSTFQNVTSWRFTRVSPTAYRTVFNGSS